MQRPGSNQMDMQPTDFLCDFCARQWDGAFPMVEGHQGSLICGRCLSVAFSELALRDDLDSDSDSDASAEAGDDTSAAEDTPTCTLCLEVREGPHWISPARDARVCLRCVKQSAGRLHKDPDWDWSKPT